LVSLSRWGWLKKMNVFSFQWAKSVWAEAGMEEKRKKSHHHVCQLFPSGILSSQDQTFFSSETGTGKTRIWEAAYEALIGYQLLPGPRPRPRNQELHINN
jgi:hypothetical protein